MNDKNWNERTELLLGADKLGKLINSHVLIVGLGGVGGIAAEFICRAGVGKLTIIDGDIVDTTNRNRQIAALTSTVGISKAEVLEKRLFDINPDVELNVIDRFIEEDEFPTLLENGNFDYVIDAIDTIGAKLSLILACLRLKIKFISSMGAGDKIDPSKIKVVDISSTYGCGLAKSVRKKLRIAGIHKGVKVVFSYETGYGSTKNSSFAFSEDKKVCKTVVGTISYMPSIFGCLCASEAIRFLISEKHTTLIK